MAVTAGLVEAKDRGHLKAVGGQGLEAGHEEKEREMGVAGREVGGRRVRPGTPAEEVRENLQRAPGWRSLSILQ